MLIAVTISVLYDIAALAAAPNTGMIFTVFIDFAKGSNLYATTPSRKYPTCGSGGSLPQLQQKL